MIGTKITPESFNEIKHFVRWHTNNRTAQKFGISIKTALQVRGCNTYAQYRENVKAQHPDIKYSLADDVLELHSLRFNKHDNNYKCPRSARQAVQELLLNA